MTPRQREQVTIEQACVAAGVSRRTIYHWLKDKKVEFVRTAGGNVRIFRDTLFLDPPTPEPAT